MNNKRSRTKKNSQCTCKSSQKEKSQKLSRCFSLLLPWLSTLRLHDENPVGRESAKCSQISHHRDQNKHKQGPTDRTRDRGEHRQERERERQRERESLQVALQQTTSGFVLRGKGGREGEDKRQKEISIAKKIYLKFKGLKLCDFGNFQ